MNERFYLENNLLLLKSTVEVYIHGTLESKISFATKLNRYHRNAKRNIW